MVCDGVMQTTREWNGLVKSVLDGDADMIVTALQITPERIDIIDFSVPYLETGISILVAVRDGVISPTAFLGKYKLNSPFARYIS
jgi:ionotropic glutamate receptor NMDA 2B